MSFNRPDQCCYFSGLAHCFSYMQEPQPGVTAWSEYFNGVGKNKIALQSP